jgi:predicted O-methyltransferase YrrM
MTSTNFKNSIVEKNYKFVKEHSWKTQTEQFLNTIIKPITFLNWTNDVPKGTKKSFEKVLSLLPPKAKILEIGTYKGTSVIEMLKTVPESVATVIDAWEDYYEYDNLIEINTNLKADTMETEFYKNTLPFKDRIRVLKGYSRIKLTELLLKHDSFNFIYVDGSHRCLDVYLDAELSWKLLKIGGIIAFDDYHFNQGDNLNSPYEAIKQFMDNHKDDFVVLAEDYRIYLKKIN